MNRPVFVAAGLLSALGLGCGVLPGPVGLDSGISGLVEAGPTCPVVRPGMDCADRPIAATIIVRFASNGLEATRFTSGMDGTFHVPLPPGAYTLQAQPAGYLGTPPPQNVDVQSGRFTNVTIDYDTGIR